MKKEIGYHIGSMTVIKFIFGFEFADRYDINEKWPELPLLSLIMWLVLEIHRYYFFETFEKLHVIYCIYLWFNHIFFLVREIFMSQEK